MKYNLPVNYTKLTPKERRNVRLQYIEEQKGNCSFCGCSLMESPSEKVSSAKINKSLFPSGFFKHPVHLHHCHRSGMTIGAVHNKCNAYLWQYLGE